jgi:cytochrome c oxidase assembly protein subunit 11
VLKITFSADVNDAMPWKFKPQQSNVNVVPGETALAFYKATNPTKKAITGVATYNVFPPKAGEAPSP